MTGYVPNQIDAGIEARDRSAVEYLSWAVTIQNADDLRSWLTIPDRTVYGDPECFQLSASDFASEWIQEPKTSNAKIDPWMLPRRKGRWSIRAAAYSTLK